MQDNLICRNNKTRIHPSLDWKLKFSYFILGSSIMFYDVLKIRNTLYTTVMQ